MSTGYRIYEKDGAHFLTFQVVGWVDLFTRRDYRNVVIESFKYRQQHKGLNLLAFVIMSNHIIPRPKWGGRLERIHPTLRVTPASGFWLWNRAWRVAEWMRVFEHYATYTGAPCGPREPCRAYIQPEVYWAAFSIHNNPIEAALLLSPKTTCTGCKELRWFRIGNRRTEVGL